MILLQVTVHLDTGVGVVQHLPVANEIVAQGREPARSRGKRQILTIFRLMKLDTTYIREGVFEMQGFYGMDMKDGLTTEDAGIASVILEYRGVINHRSFLSLQEDIVVDMVGKDGQLGRYNGRRVVHTRIKLPAVFRIELVITDLIPQCSLMLTIAAQLTHIRCAESS